MTAERARGASSLARVEAILSNPELYALADTIPTTDPTAGGRPRDYPAVAAVLFEALISVYGSARQVEAEISHPTVWNLIRTGLHTHGGVRVDRKPMRRHHYLYLRNTYLTDPDVLARLDKTTGELIPLRAEHDADLHFEGPGEFAWGTKWVIMAARGEHLRHRIILDIAPVPDKGGEAAVVLTSLQRITPGLPGAQGVVYDTALRGVHHQRILRNLGLLPINRVALAKVGSKKPRRNAVDQRQQKSALIETKTITLPDGTERTVALYAKGGALGVGRLTDDGSMIFEALRRVRTHRRADPSGRDEPAVRAQLRVRPAPSLPPARPGVHPSSWRRASR